MSDIAGVWTEAQVAGHLCDIYEPPQPREQTYVLIYLHGVHLARLCDKSEFCAQFDRFGFRVIAPFAGATWWSDRRCPAFDERFTAETFVRQHVMQFIEQKWEVTPPKVGVFGTSMGGQGALRLAYKYPDVFPVTAAISPAIDYQIRYREGDEIIRAMYADEEDVRQDTATLHIHPLNWPRHQFFCCDPNDLRWIESVERLQMKLYSLGVPHQYDVETAAGGHGFDYYNDMAPRVMEFLFNALEQERRRIV